MREKFIGRKELEENILKIVSIRERMKVKELDRTDVKESFS